MTNMRHKPISTTPNVYFFLNNMDQAASAYKAFYINYPADKMVPQSMFQVGVSLFNKRITRRPRRHSTTS